MNGNGIAVEAPAAVDDLHRHLRPHLGQSQFGTVGVCVTSYVHQRLAGGTGESFGDVHRNCAGHQPGVQVKVPGHCTGDITQDLVQCGAVVDEVRRPGKSANDRQVVGGNLAEAGAASLGAGKNVQQASGLLGAALTGAGAGALVGSAGAGVGAVPGAIVGAAVGVGAYLLSKLW